MNQHPGLTPTATQYRPQSFRVVLLAALLAGSLDALAAIIVYGPVFGKASVLRIFQGIAAGVFGKSAYEGGVNMALLGVLFHYCIAFLFAAAYFFLYPRLAFLRKNKWVSGILYGLIVWLVMSRIVLPLAGLGNPLRLVAFLRASTILIICVGIPIAWVTDYYRRANN